MGHSPGLEEVPAVEDDRFPEPFLDEVEIRVAVLVPFGDDDEGIGAGDDVIQIVAVINPVAEDLLCFPDRFGIMGLDVGAQFQKPGKLSISQWTSGSIA